MQDNILQNINSPEDIKKLSYSEIAELCSEIREQLIFTASKNGGHLASNLGVVELTVAMHRVFSSPEDQFVFDVGHQCYTHKLLTGRREQFPTIRTKGGISGFPKPCESVHDPVICGHSSMSISAACGLARAKKLDGDDHFVVAVIGDGALTGGMAYEGLNNAGRCRDNIIVILNDNKMSISKNVGAMARYLAVIRSKTSYIRFKTTIARIFGAIPLIGKPIRRALFRSKAALKNAIYKSTLFEDMGFAYLGPVDGHDQKLLERTLSVAKSLNRPSLIHVCTLKGKGYSPAERQPRMFHGIGKFDIDTGEPKTSGDTFSDVFGRVISQIAREDEDVCAVTAAMKMGTGLAPFAQEFYHRFYDCGIAEEHALTFCGGLAANGKKPVLAIYSSFLQRGYDQIIHDIATGSLNVTIAVDRAGIVGEDGETHQGVFDCAMLNTVPGLSIYSPATFAELDAALRECIAMPGAAAVRYPRGGEPNMPKWYTPSYGAYDLLGRKSGDVLIVTYGRLAAQAADACAELFESGVSASLLKLNRIKPIDEECAKIAAEFKLVYFFEEGIRQGGICESMAALLLEHDFKGRYRIRAIDNEFVKQAAVNQALEELGLDCAGVVKSVREELAHEQ